MQLKFFFFFLVLSSPSSMPLSYCFVMNVNYIYISCWGMIGCCYCRTLSAWSLVIFLPWFILVWWWSGKLGMCCRFLFLLEYVVSLGTEKLRAGKLSMWCFLCKISRLWPGIFIVQFSIQTCMVWYKVSKSGRQEKGTAFPLYLFQKRKPGLSIIIRWLVFFPLFKSCIAVT